MVANPQKKEDEIPEWFSQRLAIKAGEAGWDDFSFLDRTSRGWLIPYLLPIEGAFWGRWDYWWRTLEVGKLLDEPIPQIEFLPEGFNAYKALPKKKREIAAEGNPVKMLTSCIDNYACYGAGVRLPDFFEWILWGLGGLQERPRFASHEKVNEHWYRTFNLGLLIQYPHDYLGDMLADTKAGKTYWNNPHAFFPTPHTVVDCMVRMNFPDAEKTADGKDPRTLSVMDPCVGTGRFLMHASNYSVNLYGVDIDPVCILATKINGFLYMPWLVRPAPWLAMMQTIECRDSLRNPPVDPTPQPDQKKANVIFKKDQLKLF